MTLLRTRRISYYSLTALNMLASSYYFNYLFFLLRDRFGFGNRENLWVAALHGAIYIVSAWQCGRFAERRGYDRSLQIGFAGLTLCMMLGWWSTTAAGVIASMAVYSVVLLFTWPALEALTTEGVAPQRVPHMVGVYNCTWAGTAALAYFTGGPLYDWLGSHAIFTVPGLMFLAGFGWSIVVGRCRAARGAAAVEPFARAASVAELSSAPRAGVPGPRNATFLRLAWLANPLSYVSVYTLFAVMPGIALALGLSPTEVGLFCAVWLFARMAAFVILWQWTGWHYRFRWLAGAYLVLATSFLGILLAPVLWAIVLAQIAFGLATGLLYYSSLFYSMDASAARAEHGGLHEAGIGAGIFAGPALGALSISWFPGTPHAAAFAVSTLLAAGFLALLIVWRRGAR